MADKLEMPARVSCGVLWKRAVSTLSFVSAYLRVNLAAAMEYRASFITQCVGMMLNDAIMFVFWWLYFERFPAVRGWELRDVVMLWAVVATSFGLAVTLFGNSSRLATLIVQGQLDYYLALPRDVLLHVLVSRMSLPGWGDVAFGLAAFLLAGRLDPATIVLYSVLVGASMAVFLAFQVLAGSLAFFIGNAETAATQAQNTLVTLSLYPGSLFRGWTKLLLFTLLPAAFTAHVPVGLLRRFDPAGLAVLLGFACGSMALAVSVFRLGLRRYESGNLMTLRG
jgi:ABC-2 type transport system permease protein